MEAAQPLDGEDSAPDEDVHRFGEDRVRLLPRCSPCARVVEGGRFVVEAGCPLRRSFVQDDMGTAFETSVRLGVEASVGGVGVLLRACVAHGKRRHGRRRPVVGQRVDNGEPGTAVCAVHKRVAITPVLRVEEFVQAVGACRQIGRDQRALLGSCLLRFPDFEARAILEGDLLELDFGYARGCGRVHVQLGHELVEELTLAFGVDEHPVEVVEHPAGNDVLTRKPVDERPEADSLDNAAHADVERIYQPRTSLHDACRCKRMWKRV